MGSIQASYGFVSDPLLLPSPTTPPVGDRPLVRAAIAGDRQACHAIWRKYAPLVQRVVRRFFGPGPDLPDVCQEAFLRIFRRMREVRDPDALAGFILSVTLGVARNEARRRKVRAILGLRPTQELPLVADDGRKHAAREEVVALYRLLDTLSIGDRSLFVARYVEKLEVSEVASLHNISLSTAKRRLRRVAENIDHRMQSEPALQDYVGRLRERVSP
jgi:RNA polymerase sigma-70 factor (ECF subfamily)